MERQEIQEFVNALKDFIFLQRELESAKIELVLRQDFNLIDAFAILDFDNTGFCSSPQVITALEEVLGLGRVDREDVFLFFKKYDANCDGRISYFDFSQAILPLSEEYASLLRNRPQYF
jgi:Ca2+-binding EF-hand superfamily protein